LLGFLVAPNYSHNVYYVKLYIIVAAAIARYDAANELFETPAARITLRELASIRDDAVLRGDLDLHGPWAGWPLRHHHLLNTHAPARRMMPAFFCCYLQRDVSPLVLAHLQWAVAALFACRGS
jgi:hypothetical protein